MSGLLLRIARDPLLHFLAIGAVFFLVLGRGAPAPVRDEITVTKEDVARIAAGFATTWQRPPTQEELQGAIADDVREEVLYRAGTELGLDSDDTIVRRRIAQKMGFFLEGTVEAPTDADLKQYLRQNVDRFRTDPLIAFRQVFISSKRANAREDAEALLPTLVSVGREAPALGDTMLLPEVFGPTPLRDIASQFGDGFARELAATKPGAWAGPIVSAYGYHLVLVASVTPAYVPELGDVRDAVAREWYAERRRAVLGAKYNELRSRYVIRIDGEASAP
jgi:PPIC-type PPIASE domain